MWRGNSCLQAAGGGCFQRWGRGEGRGEGEKAGLGWAENSKLVEKGFRCLILLQLLQCLEMGEGWLAGS